jgi:KaiC/GvpD/RAD55 family RecA-like ATPase|tara:strand:+ start:25193 stop:26185 length:993 start_codon:yes stop_codon:yes gene_type:complete
MPDRISIEDAFDLVGQAATETPVVAAPKVKEVDGISNGDLNRLFTPKSEQMKRMRSDLRVGNEWRFGIRQFDEATLGGARAGQLITLIGKTHTGKTMVGMNMVARNPNHRTLWVSPDETETMFWGRYSAMKLEVSQSDWISRLIRGDEIAWERMTEVVDNQKNLHFESTGMSVDDLDKAMRIASTQLWNGERPQVLVYDYLELIRGGTGDAQSVQAKIESFKQLVSDWRIVGVMLHQSGRGAGQRGSAGGIDSGRFGSTSESHFVFETWRRWDDTSLDEETRSWYQDEISVGLHKNKAGEGQKAEVNLTIHPSGRLLEAGVSWEQMSLDE